MDLKIIKIIINNTMNEKDDYRVTFTGGTKTHDGLKIHTDILNKMLDIIDSF